jgi:hypothetical protein
MDRPTAIREPPSEKHFHIDCFRECKLIMRVHKIWTRKDAEINLIFLACKP